MSTTDPEPKETQIIPDFFYEFIARIIPGLVFIALCLYWSDSDFKAISASVGLSLFVLVAAWIIGTTLDLGVFVIVNLICPKCLLEKIPAPHPDTWDHLCKTKSWEREIYKKTEAVCIFYRSMASICALMVFLIFIVTTFSLTLDSVLPALTKHLPALLRHPWVYGILGVIFFFVFVSCWWAQKNALEAWSARFAKKLNQERSGCHT
jgi:hypothetical protein